MTWLRGSGVAVLRPCAGWWLAVPPLLVGLTAGQGFAFSVSVVGAELLRGVGQFALRRYPTWLVSVALAVLLGAFDGAFGLASGFCLTALRWRLNSIWPLVVLHSALLPAASWWLAVALVAYGGWLLWSQPVIRMSDRPTVRVVCFDGQGRVLLARWRDPSNGLSGWDAPGGGIEPGETPQDAARRELREETGLLARVLDRHVVVRRDLWWNNRRVIGDEPYYLAFVDQPPPVDRSRSEPHELRLITEFRWVPPAEARHLPGQLQVPDFEDVARELVRPQST